MRPPVNHKEVPLSEAVDEVVSQDPRPAAVRSSKAPHVDHIEEDIELHATAPIPPLDKSKALEVDEEIEYDDDFEAAEDDEEQYRPQVPMATASTRASPSPPDSERSKLVTIRPNSASQPRAPSPQEPIPVAPEDIKKALASENEKLTKRSGIVPTDASRKKAGGFLSEYESTMPKFNLSSSSSPSEKALLSRLSDLKRLKIFGKRTVEKTDLFQQRPTKEINLFLAGKSLKYCNLKSTSSQTGDDDVEIGVMTDDIWRDDKEMQFPTLTMGQGGKVGSDTSQMLPFLRRVLPLFEASMAENRQRQGAGSSAGRGGDQGATSVQARFGLAESFVDRHLGAQVSIVDIAICPQWYGADHASVLYTLDKPLEAKQMPPSVGSSLDTFVRPLRSIIGLYPILSSVASDSDTRLTRPVRCFYSLCRLGSLAVVPGRPHLVVAGSEMGSLLVFDLRSKARSPSELTSSRGSDSVNPDPDVAHFEGPIWHSPGFSTDLFAVSTGQAERDFDLRDEASIGGLSGAGVHSVEICCLRCSDIAGGDPLIFALDSMGVVSFWRALEDGNSAKLALQGSLSLAAGAHLLGDFLSASYLCIHPQQQARFVVVSASGVRQANRGRSFSIADGPNSLDLVPIRDEDLPGPFLSQPCCAAFSPFFPGLLLAAYAEGDLALFDCSVCVPITHWGGAVSKAPSRSIAVAWSPIRPCVFFVKCEDTLDVWDLAEKSHSPVQSLHLGPGADTSPRAPCVDLFVSADGRPIVGLGGSTLIIGLPSSLTTPLQALPRQHCQEEKPLEELLVEGYEKTQLFPTLARHCRTVEVPRNCSLERDVLRRILAGVHPMQAWV